MLYNIRHHKKRGTWLSILGMCRNLDQYIQKPGSLGPRATIVFPLPAGRSDIWMEDGDRNPVEPLRLSFHVQFFWRLPTPSQVGDLYVLVTSNGKELECHTPRVAFEDSSLCVPVPVGGYTVWLTLVEADSLDDKFMVKDYMDPKLADHGA